MDISNLKALTEILSDLEGKGVDLAKLEKLRTLLKTDENQVALSEYSSDYDADFLTLIGELDEGGGYDWSTLRVYRNNLNNLIGWGYASGCSCNSWTDDFSRFSDLNILTDWNHFIREVMDCRVGSATDKVELISKVAKVWDEHREKK